ncbi:unnamed protein product [Echinostoma caproni]|uniref:Aa_trans domain-containing protein n=1 Tax=Echinostoma caproni TaxID=27848 RepID=A0A183B5Z7_9TREM|nr:unnamed protein product [Echinostoma caproni]
MSAYTGAVLNYLTIGVVLFGGLFGDMTPSEVTVLISQVSVDYSSALSLFYFVHRFARIGSDGQFPGRRVSEHLPQIDSVGR